MDISRNYNRGKSFRFKGSWCPGIVYKNDDYTQDFVKHDGVLYACSATFTSKMPGKSADWESVIGSINGTSYIPHVDADGNLTWTNDAGLKNPPSINIMGPVGEKGEIGEKGDPGENGTDGLSAYQIWLNVGNSGSELDFLNSLKGDSIEQTIEWGFWKN